MKPSNSNQSGIVVKSTGSWYDVELSCGTVVQCKIKGNLRLKGFRCTNPVAVGDVVSVELRADDTAFITAIEPRRNYIIRRASNLSREFQILAANIDQTALVASLKQPETNLVFIDRFLATAMAYNVPAILVINKIDLLTDDVDPVWLRAVTELYRGIGYVVHEVSAATGEGIDALANALEGKTTLLSGNSGVGKSSLINRLIPDASLRVGDVSAAHDKGMHTTTFSEMLRLPAGGKIIDTPGVKGFGTIDFKRSEIAHYFPEIFREAAQCRFANCTHTHEPGCAVLKAIDEERISTSRYNSYLSIMDDQEPDKYRKPF